MAEIWLTDLLERCSQVESHGALQYRPFYCQCLSMEIAWLCAQFFFFLQLSTTDVAEIAKSTNLKSCPHTFGHVVYILLISLSKPCCFTSDMDLLL
jgi:hypothetical protein